MKMKDLLKLLDGTQRIVPGKKGGTRFIKNGKWIKSVCRDPEHNPPNMIVIPKGYSMEHTCPTCGKITIVSGGPTAELSI